MAFQEKKEKKTGLRMVLLIQSMVLLYSFVSMLSKIASGMMEQYGFWSWQFILLFCGMVGGLGVYAVLWQQVLKKVELITAYVHKSTTLLWSLVWSATIFHETIQWNNVVGIVIIVVGIILVTQDD